MNAIKNKMIKDAQRRFSSIYPVKSRNTLQDCFTVEKDIIIFWFNTDDASTHTIIEAL